MKYRVMLLMLIVFVCFIALQVIAQTDQGTIIQPSMLAKMSQVKLSGKWLPTKPGAQISLPSRLNIQAKSNETSLSVDVPGFAAEDMKGPDGTVYQQITIPNGGHTADIGKPELATIGAMVEVPRGVKAKITVAPAGDTKVYENMLIWPAQKQGIDKTGAEEPEFVKDEAAYRLDAFVPSNMMVETTPSVIRGVSVVNVIIVPMQYNAAKKQLKVFSRMTVKVEFVGSPAPNWQARRAKYATPEFAASYKNIVPSYIGALPKLQASASMPSVLVGVNIGAVVAALDPNEADFLIICPTGWKDIMVPLATWREATGFRTKIVETGSITGGTTAQGIANYIKNAYDNWDVPPIYVLLVGDANLIPTFYKTAHPDSYEQGKLTGTDLYYSTVDGTDLFPDIAVGRFAVSTAAEATMMANKVINYEKNPPAGTWTNKVLVASGYQSGRYFHITSDAIASFLSGKGYSVTKVYKGGSYTGTTAQVTNAINAGAVLVTHRDHGDSRHGPYGGSDGWSEPSFVASNASALTNGAMLPIVLTLNCRTGWFDDETDKDTTDPGGNCLAEAFMRNPNGGAVATIGASRISYSGYNDEFAKGLIDGIWSDFDPTYSAGGSSIARIGNVLNVGKTWMYDKYVVTGGGTYPWDPDSIHTTTEFEIFNLLGDPCTRIWKQSPSAALTATLVKISDKKVRVTVKQGTANIQNALVSLHSGTGHRHFRWGSTDSSGNVTFDVPDATKEFTVTASKWPARPFQSKLTAKSLTLSPLVPGVIQKIDEPIKKLPVPKLEKKPIPIPRPK